MTGAGDTAADRLAAAGPDMLKALHQAKAWLDGWGSAGGQLAVVNAAIAKAEGPNTTTANVDADEDFVSTDDAIAIGLKVIEAAGMARVANAAIPRAEATWTFEIDDLRFRIVVTVEAQS